MDLSPRYFTAPFTAFELATHTLATDAAMLLASNAWLTHQSRASLAARAAEPDWETLSYWVERLSPLLESSAERLVVIANRTGLEEGGTRVVDLEKVTGPPSWEDTGRVVRGEGLEEARVKEKRKDELESIPGAEPVAEKDDESLTDGESRYAGTSCVLGLGNDRFRLWGVLGRAEEGVLRVDTGKPPKSVWVPGRRGRGDHSDDDDDDDTDVGS
jgi:hypothetical protein